MTNSLDPDQTVPIGADSDLSPCCLLLYLKFVSNVWQLFVAEDLSRPHFQMHFFSWRIKG